MLDGDRRPVPRGEIRLVDAGHVTIHLRHPEAVAGAIRDLLSQSAGS